MGQQSTGQGEDAITGRMPNTTITKFVDACMYNQVPVVRRMLSEGVDINARDSSGRTGLYRAMSNNKTDTVRLLPFIFKDLVRHPLAGRVSFVHQVGTSAFTIAMGRLSSILWAFGPVGSISASIRDAIYILSISSVECEEKKKHLKVGRIQNSDFSTS